MFNDPKNLRNNLFWNCYNPNSNEKINPTKTMLRSLAFVCAVSFLNLAKRMLSKKKGICGTRN
ncbi:hypothetical protein Mgra_00009213 [Meloidogyne graminicola]|uniref:Uncharacterized protein n=1 Tax=Meloidogyne graminicola TaxID=189291 RepID=A0A8S9ZDM0_9BILA|nr:hypothetical protein Mgra_00009213 [Meloidogyne graminicola]